MRIRFARGLRRLGVACVLGGLLTHASNARADEGARLRLTYEAPAECEAASVFRERVTSLVRSPPSTWKNAADVRVVIERVDRVFVGRLGVDRAAAERSLRASSCASVVAALAVSAALAVDEAVAASSAPEPPPSLPIAEEPPPPPPKPTPKPKPRMPEPARGKAPFELAVGDAVGVRRGLAPDPLVLQSASLVVARPHAWWPPPLRAEVAYGASPISRTPRGAYRTRLFEVGLSACTPDGKGISRVVGLCAGGLVGALQTSSFEVVRPARRARAWGGVFASPRASLPITARLKIVIEGSVIVPFVRETQVFYPNVEVYTAAPIAFQGTLGIELRLPRPER